MTLIQKLQSIKRNTVLDWTHDDEPGRYTCIMCDGSVRWHISYWELVALLNKGK